MRARHLPTVAALAAGLLVALAAPASAAFPGENGRIAYAIEEGSLDRLWSALPDGSGAAPLTEAPGDQDDPVYSPDGTRIAAEIEDEVWVMNSDGSDPRRLTNNEYRDETDVDWIEDYEDPETGETYPWVRVEREEGSIDEMSDPAFGPTGTTLAVEHVQMTWWEESICAVPAQGSDDCIPPEDPGHLFDEDEGCTCSVVIKALDATTGADLGPLTSGDPEREEWAATYSADGKLAFVRFAPGDLVPSLWIVPTPGAEARPLVPDFWGEADFSPDGTRLVIVPSDADLLRIVDAASGATVRTIQIPVPLDAWAVPEDPVFSPDGSRIAFRMALDAPGGSEWGIYAIGVDGSGMGRVVDEGKDPAWQPIPSPPPAPAPSATPFAPPPAVAPSLRRRKGKIRLDRRGRAVIGRIECGSSACLVRVRPAKLKIGKGRHRARLLAPRRIAAGKSAKLRVKVAGRALRALRRAKRGRLDFKIRIADANGPRQLPRKATLLAPKPKPKPGRGGRG